MSFNGIVVPEFRIRILTFGSWVGITQGRTTRAGLAGWFVTNQVLNKSSEFERSFPKCRSPVCSFALRLRSLVVLAIYT